MNTHKRISDVYQKRLTCRSCDSESFETILELGEMPLANSFLRSETEFAGERRFPLNVCICSSCALVQILDVIDPNVLFGEYIYVSGTSETILEHYEEYAETVVRELGIGPSGLVVEVASNDGSLLARFKKRGVKTLGVEPATNIAEQANQDGIETVNEFFSLQTARNVLSTHGKASAIVANNVLAHVDDPRDFLRGCRELLRDEGMVVVEAPYLRELVERLEYDTVYHEHLCYFSVTALMTLFKNSGLTIQRIDRVPVHGGSLRVFGQRDDTSPDHASTVKQLAQEEVGIGLTDAESYQPFTQVVRQGRDELLRLLSDLAQNGKRVAGYGAPAKGNTLLNYCGINTQLLPFTVDRNQRKVGLFTPGTHIPVLPVETILERNIEYLLILAWNFADEIMRQQQAFRDRGGQFIVPIPTATVV